MPELAAEQWAVIQAIDYQKMYIGAVKALYQSYMAHNYYEKALSAAEKAYNMYHYESFAVMNIDALMALGYFQRAMAVLNEVSKSLFSDMGVMPSEDILKRYEDISKHVGNSNTSLKKVKKRLREEIVGGSAYYCAFPSIIDCYRILSRISMRSGSPITLVICMMTDSQGSCLEHGHKGLECTPFLIDVIENSLRIGDVYTRTNDNQILILLSGLTLENCYLVTDRISKKFKDQKKTRGLKLNFSITTAAEVMKSNQMQTEPM